MHNKLRRGDKEDCIQCVVRGTAVSCPGNWLGAVVLGTRHADPHGLLDADGNIIVEPETNSVIPVWVEAVALVNRMLLPSRCQTAW